MQRYRKFCEKKIEIFLDYMDFLIIFAPMKERLHYASSLLRYYLASMRVANIEITVKMYEKEDSDS